MTRKDRASVITSLVATLALALTLTGCLERTGRHIQSVMLVDDGAALDVHPSSCNENAVVTVEETDTEVRLSAVADRAGPDGADCLDTVRVTLESPVGDRAIIDTATGEEVTVDPH